MAYTISESHWSSRAKSPHCFQSLWIHPCDLVTSSRAIVVGHFGYLHLAFISYTLFSLVEYFHATLWLSFCSLVLRFLTVQWLPFHSTTVRSDFRPASLFLEGKSFSSFLNLSWRVRLPYLEIMVYWLIYNEG